ncbi:MAG: GNAT family N-acetyltransferase [Gemmatimonadota bacterium]|nr:GNAT family N-acetyltransferase [Gemmatimonadota bacterium]
MSETFRLARADEVPQVARVVAHSFVGHPASYYEHLMRHGPWGGLDALWVCEDQGRIAAVCQLLPLQQWVGGTRLQVMGMASVAVAPTHRRRGLAARLVTSGMRFARERGDVATALYPFRASFYQKLGYGLAGEAYQYRVPPEVIPDAPERLGIALVESEDARAEVRDVYERWAPTQTGQLRRTDAIWKRLLQSDGRVVVVYRDQAGSAEGYAVARYRADLPVDSRFLEIEERAWLSPEARRGLYAWMGSLADQWQQLVYRAHPAERFGDRIEEPRILHSGEPGWNLWFPSAVLLAGPMFRLLDLAAAFAARPQIGSATLTLRLEVEDTQIPENAGSWQLRLDNGRPHFGVATTGAADATLSLGIDTLSRIFVGALRPSEAVDAGVATIDRPKELPTLDQAFALPRPWTFDAF